MAAPGNGPLGNYRLPLSPYHSGRKTLADVMRFRGDLRRVSDAIEWLVRETRADMLYVNGPRILPFVRAGRPVIFHAHSRLNRRYGMPLRFRTRCRTAVLRIPGRKPAAFGGIVRFHRIA